MSRFGNYCACSALAAALACASTAQAVPVQFAGTGNYYEAIIDNVDWATAKSNAAGMSFMGMNGHLATITSAGENEFIARQLGDFGRAWIGGGDPATEGEFYWQDGPESGSQFWTGGLGGSAVTYANFPAGEPNNVLGNEEYVEIFYFGGSWNDQEASDRISYIVEYSMIPEPSSLGLALLSSVALLGLRRRS